MATHSSTLAWKIPWMGEPGRPWGPRVYGVAKSPKVQRDFTFTLELVFDSVSFHDIQLYFSSVQFSHSVVSDPLPPHESQHARPPCLSKTPGVYSNTCPSSWWCHWAISSSAVPFFSCPQFLPASGSFPTSQLFAWMCILVHPLSARPKYWSFSFNISPSNEHPGLIFRMDWLDLLAVQGTLKSLLQHHSSNLNYSYWLNTAPRTLHCPPPPHTHTHTHTHKFLVDALFLLHGIWGLCWGWSGGLPFGIRSMSAAGLDAGKAGSAGKRRHHTCEASPCGSGVPQLRAWGAAQLTPLIRHSHSPARQKQWDPQRRRSHSAVWSTWEERDSCSHLWKRHTAQNKK